MSQMQLSSPNPATYKKKIHRQTHINEKSTINPN